MKTARFLIPYINLSAQHSSIKEELVNAMQRVLDHGKFILGPEVEEFEQKFAKICQVNHAIAVNSGTDALILALRSLGIGPGDEVITVPNSFVSSTGCIVLAGAQPVLVDVRPDYNLDPSQIEQVITPRTKAILPVHLTGRPADMEPIMMIARQYGLHVIEDCAQAVLAEYKGQRVGSMGPIGCFSLHPLKTLNACGDGGVITTNDAALAESLRTLRNIGLRSRDDCVVWSGNSRLDTLQAAILLVKLKYLENWTEKRRSNARYYTQALAAVAELQIPRDRPYEKAVYHTFVIQAERRDALKKYLLDQGIETAIHYPVPIHLHTAAAGLGYSRGSLPVAEQQAEQILSLPVYPELRSSDLEYIADSISSFYHR